MKSATALDRLGGTRYVLVMGVSGAGKSTIGRALAERLGGSFLEADDLHPAENIQRMSDREPLTDALRLPWLQAITKEALALAERNAGPIVIACSALKRSYRDVLRKVLVPLSIIHLSGPIELIRARLQERHSHFMPVELLASQLATLEDLGPDEESIAVPIDQNEESIISRALDSLGSRAQQQSNA